MRLKILFFPLMLIICLFVFLSYIRPEIDSLTAANKQKADTQEKINDIGKKEAAAKNLSQKIRETSEYKDVVYNYLPSRKVEEQIIAGINYLASGSQVYLADISIEDAAPQKTAVFNATVSDPNLLTEAGEAQNEGMLFSKATIKIIGEYEKMQLFFDKLQKMALINNIKSLKIYKEENLSNSASAANSNEATSDNKSTSLLAEIVMDFGYLKKIKIDENKLEQFQIQTTLDESTVKALTGYRELVSVSSDLQKESTLEGRPNPFIP